MAKKDCREYCGRKAKKPSPWCCMRCQRSQGYGDHSDACDEREAIRAD